MFAKRGVLIPCLLAVVLVVASCSSGGNHAAVATTTTGTPRTTLTRPRPPVSTRLELSTRVVTAGGSIAGTLVVDNESGKPIESGPCADWDVLLVTGQAPGTQPGLVKCSVGPVFPAGVSRYSFTVAAKYHSCGAVGYRDNRVVPSGPRCLKHGGAPPLPAGSYRATLVEYLHVAVPLPTPVTVRVVQGETAPTS